MASRRSQTKRKYGSAADRAKAAAQVAGPGGGGGTMFQNIPQGVNFYKPEEGKATIRILPYVVSDPKHPDGDMAPVGDIWYKRPYKRFRSIGVDKKPYISPKSIGKPCPIMEYYAAAKANPDISDQEANRAKPQDVVMYNVQVIDKNNKTMSEPMFFYYSYHNFEKMLKKELMDPDNEEFLTFMDLEGGFDIRVRWEKESFDGNPYLVAGNISFIERDDIDEEILDRVVDLDNVLVVKSYTELQNIFLELDVEDDDEGSDEEGEETPPSRPARRGKTATPDPEPEPEKPARRARKTAKPDPEPEKPARRRRTPESDPEPDPESENPCPNGFVYGDDFDTKKPCDKCDKFDDCGDKFDADRQPAPNPKTAGKSSKPGKAAKQTASSDDNECPAGHVFGVDCDNKPECGDCPKWDECMDRQEELEAK